MYRVDRNNFYQESKNASVQTPNWVSNFLFELLNPHIEKNGIIFDPCVGEGSLLRPWKNNSYEVQGVDIKKQGFEETICQNYLLLRKDLNLKVSLAIMNPPFNIDKTTVSYIKKNYSGRPLLPEIWLKKTIELFGKNIPIVVFTPYGFRLNQSLTSKRWKYFFDGEYPKITSIISLPKDVFKDVLFHSEILVFNLPNLRGHYFCGEKLTK